jgi:hypothetical protein
MVDKPADADDPMGLVAVDVLQGDPDLMAECLVEEFVRLGLTDERLLALFRSPFYAGAHAIWRARGDAHVTALITRVRARWGHPRFTVRHATGPEATEPGPGPARATED